MATIKRTPRFRSTSENGRGRGTQAVRARRRASMGIMMKRTPPHHPNPRKGSARVAEPGKCKRLKPFTQRFKSSP